MNNNENNFINHIDPTLSINLDNISLENQYTKLTEEEKNLVMAKLLGMDRMPVDIMTFISDDFFLGGELLFNHGNSIFPFWFDKLKQIFPSPIYTKYPFISYGGCVGSGKSTNGKIIGLYYLHRLDCCKNIYNSLGMAGGIKLAMGFFHASAETALRDFVQYFKSVYDISPYFRSQYHNVTDKVRLIASGPQSTGAVLGSQLCFSILSELGFMKISDGVNKASEVVTRFDSRFANKRHYFGGVIADSSAKDEDNTAVKTFENSVPPKDLLKVSESLWNVRPELFKESEGKTFKFYIGDAVQGPRVIEDGEDLIKSGLHEDRIIDVPISAKYKFLTDPIRNLRDLAGISYSGTEKFFPTLQHVMACSSLKNYAPEEIIVDFYDKEDTIFSHVSNMVYRIPRGTSIFLHYDIGLKKDKTGVSICYYDGEKVIGDASYPKFKIPVAFVVSRKKGQSTSLDHLYQFIVDLKKNGYNVIFSADSFASAGIFQSCERDNIEYKAISMDKTMDAYNMFKNIIDTERIEMPYNNILLRECSEIKLTYNGKDQSHAKIDHPEVSSCVGMFDYVDSKGSMPGTKDLVDAVCGSLYSCYQKYAEYLENGGGMQKSLQVMDKLTKNSREETQKYFQDQLEGLF